MSQPVTFLIIDATGRGDLARAVVTVANQLVEHREVRVISVFRLQAEARYPLDKRIQQEVLVDNVGGLSLRKRGASAAAHPAGHGGHAPFATH